MSFPILVLFLFFYIIIDLASRALMKVGRTFGLGFGFLAFSSLYTPWEEEGAESCLLVVYFYVSLWE